jgi:hypothetical protein
MSLDECKCDAACGKTSLDISEHKVRQPRAAGGLNFNVLVHTELTVTAEEGNA